MQVYLIRHTRVNVVAGTCYGRSDVALADSFLLELATLHAILPRTFTRIYTSPLQRCQQLAHHLAKHQTKHNLAKDVVADARLQEYDFGSWELQPWRTINDAYAQRWFADYVNVAAPEGESYRTMQARVLAFWQELEQERLETCAIVTHAGVIRLILAHILAIPLEKSFQLLLETGSVSLLEIGSSQVCQVHYINRTG